MMTVIVITVAALGHGIGAGLGSKNPAMGVQTFLASVAGAVCYMLAIQSGLVQ